MRIKWNNSYKRVTQASQQPYEEGPTMSTLNSPKGKAWPRGGKTLAENTQLKSSRAVGAVLCALPSGLLGN